MTKDNQSPPSGSNLRWRSRFSKKSDDDDDSIGESPPMWKNVTAAAIPQITTLALRTVLGITVALYILNQKHALPRPLSAVVSKTLFWPTMPITVSRRIGKWVTRIDNTVVMGGAPFGFLGYPEKLYEDYGVRGVVNLCEEYKGPQRKYKELGIEELHIPTTDHFEPSVKDLISAVSFIRKIESEGNSVYVHCRAGHGRSAAAVFAWLLYKDPIVDKQLLNAELCRLRNVRRTLWKQANIQQLHERLIIKGGLWTDDDDFIQELPKFLRYDDDPSSSEDDL